MSEQRDILERLRADAEDHKEVARDCDCPPECTANWRHATNCLEAADEIASLRAQLAAFAQGVKITIPTDAMEQEFAIHYRRGLVAGRKAAIEECATAIENYDPDRKWSDDADMQNQAYFTSGEVQCELVDLIRKLAQTDEKREPFDVMATIDPDYAESFERNRS